MQVLETIKQGRHALQNGKPEATHRHLEAVMATLGEAAATTRTGTINLPEQEAWSDYQEAIVSMPWVYASVK